MASWFLHVFAQGLSVISCSVASRGRLAPLVEVIRRLYRDSLTPSKRFRGGFLAMPRRRVLCLAWVASLFRRQVLAVFIARAQ